MSFNHLLVLGFALNAINKMTNIRNSLVGKYCLKSLLNKKVKQKKKKSHPTLKITTTRC